MRSMHSFYDVIRHRQRAVCAFLPVQLVLHPTMKMAVTMMITEIRRKRTSSSANVAARLRFSADAWVIGSCVSSSLSKSSTLLRRGFAWINAAVKYQIQIFKLKWSTNVPSSTSAGASCTFVRSSSTVGSGLESSRRNRCLRFVLTVWEGWSETFNRSSVVLSGACAGSLSACGADSMSPSSASYLRRYFQE